MFLNRIYRFIDYAVACLYRFIYVLLTHRPFNDQTSCNLSVLFRIFKELINLILLARPHQHKFSLTIYSYFVSPFYCPFFFIIRYNTQVVATYSFFDGR